MFMMGLFWLGLVVVAVLAAGVIFPRRGMYGMRGCMAGHGSDPLTIISERYARGELSREQYDLMRQDLLR